MKRFICLFLILFSVSMIKIADAEPVYSAHTKADLVSDVKSVQPGKALRVALRLVMDEGWHVYWKNPGDSGLAPEIQWNLPAGLKAGDIHWPLPKRIASGPLVSFGYEGEVFLIFDITVPDGLVPNQELKLQADADWLTCQVDCIPGKAKLELILPVKEGQPETDGTMAAQFLNVSKSWPVDSKDWQVKVTNRVQDFFFEITSSSDNRPLQNIFFYPDRSDLIDHAAAQQVQTIKDGITLTVAKSNILPKEGISSIQGMLVRPDGWLLSGEGQSLTVDTNLTTAMATTAPANPVTLISACVFAFLGGLILNLMPCVLPVLSLKILGLIKHSKDRRMMLMHGVCFTVGVLVCFWILAAALIVLKAAGHQVGWGFQFQSPYFVVFIAALLFVLSLNLFGLFEMGTVLSSSSSVPKKGYAGSFWGGVLATVVATPCTAPFMGTALGFAISQPAVTVFLVFTFLGLGMALPYLFLSAFPHYLKWIPKPGAWMSTLKVFLGFVLMGSVIWLIWVLGLQKGIHSVGLFMSGLLLISLGCWTIGLIQNEQATWRKILGTSFAFVTAVLLIATAAWGPVQTSGSSVSKEQGGILWQDFSQELVDDLLAQKKTVFIDFTAAWCLTCQVNDRLVFSDKQVQAAFKEFGVEAVKADWTNKDDAITRALDAYGKNSIPLYVLYHAGSDRPDILPELITPGLVIKKLRQAQENH